MESLTPDETLLGLLASQPQHGYQLLECFRSPSQLGAVWNLSTSQLYAVLKRLAQQEFISGQERASSDGPNRVEYSITTKGQQCLMAWLEVERPSASIRRIRVEFLSRLYVARLLDLPTITLVQRQRAICRERLKELTAQRELLPPGVGYLALELMIAQLQTILQWIERCELVPKNAEDTESVE